MKRSAGYGDENVVLNIPGLDSSTKISSLRYSSISKIGFDPVKIFFALIFFLTSYTVILFMHNVELKKNILYPKFSSRSNDSLGKKFYFVQIDF